MGVYERHIYELQYLLCIRSAHLGSGPRYSGFLRNLPTNTKLILVFKTREQQRETEHSLAPKDLNNNFKILKKCKNKFDCLIYEMFFIHELGPSLNVQSDSIRAKVFLKIISLYIVSFAHTFTHTFTYFYFIHIPYIFLPLCHYTYLCKFLFSTFRLIMTEERSKRREFIPLVSIRIQKANWR